MLVEKYVPLNILSKYNLWVHSQSNEPKSMLGDHQNSINTIILLDIFFGATLMPC